MVRLLNDEEYMSLCRLLAMSPAEIRHLSDEVHGPSDEDLDLTIIITGEGDDDEGGDLNAGGDLNDAGVPAAYEGRVTAMEIPARSRSGRRCPVCAGEGIRDRPDLRLIDATCSVCGYHYSTRRHPVEVRQLRQVCRRVRLELWRRRSARGIQRRQGGARG